ncbi:MAG: hypothetical protein ABW191_01675 [Aliihoeflea sp.]
MRRFSQRPNKRQPGGCSRPVVRLKLSNIAMLPSGFHVEGL